MKKIILAILDGVGYKEEERGNAVVKANPIHLKKLWKQYPHTLLEASGTKVGLPKGQMGNSEAGHMNIGAGRVVYQPSERINQSIKEDSFFSNEEILKAITHAKENQSKLHLMGLLSDGGVHAQIEHLFALLELCKKEGVQKLYLHLFTDGRDTAIKSALTYLEQLNQKLKECGIGKIATLGGRYYAMDRDNNYDRVQKGYDAIVRGIGEKGTSLENYIKKCYEEGITDEFIPPFVLDEEGVISENDSVITYNYRKDRLREILTAITNPTFKEFDVIPFSNVKVVTMFPVFHTVNASHAFDDSNLANNLGEYLEKNGLRQLRIAETEKYAHVTFYFDGGKEVDYPKEKKILIPSPKVATYDLKPEMSAYQITDILLNEMENFDVVILNFANGDMVGHTGVLEAGIKAVKTVDECVDKIYQKAMEKEYTLIVTADHGNCEEMLDEENHILTTHTTNLVPFIVTCENVSLKQKVGKLGDIAPTILDLLGLPIPKEMTGESLIASNLKE